MQFRHPPSESLNRGYMDTNRAIRRMEMWRAKFMDRKDAPPGGWHAYLVEGWTSGDWTERYRLYLLSYAWKQRRAGALTRAGRECQNCGGDSKLQVHHIDYQRVGKEQWEDVRVVCANCHQVRHATKRGAQPIPLDPRTRARLEARAVAAATG